MWPVCRGIAYRDAPPTDASVPTGRHRRDGWEVHAYASSSRVAPRLWPQMDTAPPAWPRPAPPCAPGLAPSSRPRARPVSWGNALAPDTAEPEGGLPGRCCACPLLSNDVRAPFTPAPYGQQPPGPPQLRKGDPPMKRPSLRAMSIAAASAMLLGGAASAAAATSHLDSPHDGALARDFAAVDRNTAWQRVDTLKLNFQTYHPEGLAITPAPVPLGHPDHRTDPQVPPLGQRLRPHGGQGNRPPVRHGPTGPPARGHHPR